MSIIFLYNPLLGLFHLIKVEEIIGDAADLFKDHYYVKGSGNCDLSEMSDPHNEFKGKNVLIERKEIDFRASKMGMSVEDYAAVLGNSRRKLFDNRLLRPKPHLDDKVTIEKL